MTIHRADKQHHVQGQECSEERLRSDRIRGGDEHLGEVAGEYDTGPDRNPFTPRGPSCHPICGHGDDARQAKGDEEKRVVPVRPQQPECTGEHEYRNGASSGGRDDMIDRVVSQEVSRAVALAVD